MTQNLYVEISKFCTSNDHIPILTKIEHHLMSQIIQILRPKASGVNG